MADRFLVVCEGHLTAEFDRDGLTPEAVMRAATATHATTPPVSPEEVPV